jgi:hypothetical protein
MRNNVGRFVAKDVCRARIPRENFAVEGLADNRIIRRRNDGRESGRFQLSLAARSRVRYGARELQASWLIGHASLSLDCSSIAPK